MDCPSCGTSGFYVGLYRSMEDGWCENRECLYYHPPGDGSESPKDPDDVDTKVEKKPSGLKIKTKTSGMKIKRSAYPSPYGWSGVSKP